MEAEGNNTIAPFVMKTYQMVNDPRIDSLITWGLANNSFIVVEPLEFSDKILPAFFKHNNFSSFVRQLNTYGFRKVDPDKWEFANEWFLRGQTHLLKNIVRRKNGKNLLLHCKHGGGDEGDEEEEEMFSEIMRMKKEQKDLEEELERMNRRLEATERRPEQMMEFLCKVVEEPEILPRMMLVGRERVARRISLDSAAAAAGEKKMKLAAVASCPVKNEEEDGGGVALGINSSFHLHDAEFDVDTLCQSSPENPLMAGWLSRSNNNCCTVSTTSSSSLSSSDSGGFTVATPLDVFSGYDSMGKGNGTSAATAPPYPFSLLEGSI
ncbi:PREDICTED: heat stress transcription factor C-1-like [Ipomoea nil]|uniref:heat stress transcription factor C-1-like n=1 Tax=Ipomoea nil TaxID=35883 RepID=UPI00090158D2|nr:PREDICTED: heat stress transcription factor C-1-like [Ipomoea nil]